MSKFFTDDEQVVRLWDREEVVKVINKHSYYHSNEMRREELDSLWVRQPSHRRTASLGYNNGFYVGFEEIERHYVGYREAQRFAALKPYHDADANVELCQRNLGLGCAAMNTATTPLVYIAEDGNSAQYLGYRLGFQSTGKPDGSADSYMDFGLIHCDLLKEDGAWKIWHLELERDHTVTVGQNYANVPVRRPDSEDPLYADFGKPTLEREVYNPFFGWENMWYDMPRPYPSFTDERSYGPEGNLGKPYYKRDHR